MENNVHSRDFQQNGIQFILVLHDGFESKIRMVQLFKKKLHKTNNHNLSMNFEIKFS